MNTVVTSREDILQHSRQLIQRQGWGAVSIRTVAQACGVSVGSIYNYFGSKAELVGRRGGKRMAGDLPAAPGDRELCRYGGLRVLAVWADGVREQGPIRAFLPSTPCALPATKSRTGGAGCSGPGSSCWTPCAPCCGRTPGCVPARFDSRFTPEQFADVLFSLMLSAMLRQDFDYAPALEIIRRTLY